MLDTVRGVRHYVPMTQTETRPILHSLRSDLADAVLLDIMETATVRIYGPESTAVRVWNAVERAARTLGENVTMTRDGRGWIAAVTA